MLLEAEISAVLLADPMISSLVGAQVHAVQAPALSGVRYLVFHPVSASPVDAHTGLPDFKSITLQVAAYAPRYADAIALSARALAVLLNSPLGAGASVQVQDRDSYEDTTKLFRRDLDLLLWAAQVPAL